MRTKKTLGQMAKKLVALSLDSKGRLDADKASTVLKTIAKDESHQKAALIKAFRKAVATYQKQHAVLIESAMELTKDQVQGLETAIEKKFGTNMTVTVSTNTGLIGGLKITAADMIFDQSVKGKFDKIRSRFMVVGS